MERFSGAKYACGFSVLEFPCNQFGYQEPGTNQEILNGLKYVRPGNGFQPNFPFFEKVEVNGDKEDRIYTFLKVTRKDILQWKLFLAYSLFVLFISFSRLDFRVTSRGGEPGGNRIRILCLFSIARTL